MQTPAESTAARKLHYAERVIGSIRRECLNDVIVLHEHHLCRVLRSYIEYYTPGECTDHSTWMPQQGVLSIHQSEDQSGSRPKSVAFIIITSDEQRE